MIANCCERTVGQLVAEQPARARVFEKLGIDYCCGGRKSLVEAAGEKGLPVQVLLAELESADRPAAVDERNWSDATLTELADHIEATHHAYLRRELPRIQGLLVKIADVHGRNYPFLAEVRDTFLEMEAELQSHMMKEEQILFPMCRALDSGGVPAETHCGSVANPIRVMFMEHDSAGSALARMHKLTDGYSTPADVCNTYRATMEALSSLEADLHQHIHKENNIMFPKAIERESQLCGE